MVVFKERSGLAPSPWRPPSSSSREAPRDAIGLRQIASLVFSRKGSRVRDHACSCVSCSCLNVTCINVYQLEATVTRDNFTSRRGEERERFFVNESHQSRKLVVRAKFRSSFTPKAEYRELATYISSPHGCGELWHASIATASTPTRTSRA